MASRSARCTSDPKLLVHVDNVPLYRPLASANFLHAHGIRKAPHPPYSPDFAPSDFYLLGYVKHCLVGASFADAGDLFEVVGMVLGRIQKTTLEAVFLEWIERRQKFITTCGEYTKY
jgi:hypothetical protein